jgi:UDP-galactopyranose mutase
MRGDVPYYPVRLASGQSMLDEYVDLARGAKVTFAGRLGTYRYIDMDVTIREAIDTASAIEAAVEAGSTPPSFGVSITG